MDLSGNASIDGPRQRVWSTLTNLHSLARCGPAGDPGTGLQVVDDQHARMSSQIGGGLFGARLGIDLELHDLVPPERATLGVSGQAAGTRLTGSTSFTLGGPPPGPTSIAWTAHLELDGPFAAMAEGMLQGSARTIVDGLIDCVRQQVASPESA